MKYITFQFDKKHLMLDETKRLDKHGVFAGFETARMF